MNELEPIRKKLAALRGKVMTALLVDGLLPLREPLLERLALLRVDRRVDLGDLRLGLGDLEAVEVDLVALPLAVVVGPDHPRHGHGERDRRESEQDVERLNALRHLRVAARVFLRGHTISARTLRC